MPPAEEGFETHVLRGRVPQGAVYNFKDKATVSGTFETCSMSSDSSIRLMKLEGLEGEAAASGSEILGVEQDED